MRPPLRVKDMTPEQRQAFREAHTAFAVAKNNMAAQTKKLRDRENHRSWRSIPENRAKDYLRR